MPIPAQRTTPALTATAPAPSPRKKPRDAPSIAMLKVARAYFNFTARHLPIYQQLAWQYAAEKFGITLHHKRDAGGTNGCLGNARVAIRYIGPAHENAAATVAKASNFSALIIVKIGADFSISAKWLDRRDLPPTSDLHHVITWARALQLRGECIAGAFEERKGKCTPSPLASSPGKTIKPPRQLYRQLLRLAREFHEQCPTRALPLYGPLGEIYAACKFGIALHRNATARGSDGRLGKLFVEVKTIGPKDGGCDGRVKVKKAGNFSALVIVMVNDANCVHAKMIRRKRLPAAADGFHTVPWKDFTCDYRLLVPAS